MEALETPEPSLKSFDANICDENAVTGDETISGRRRHRSKPHASSRHTFKEHRRSLHEINNKNGQNGSHINSNGNTQRKPAPPSQKPTGGENTRPDTPRDVVSLLSRNMTICW